MQAASFTEANAPAAPDRQGAVEQDAAHTELLDLLLATVYSGCEPDSVRTVLRYCKAAGVDPLQRPVRVVPLRDAASGQMRATVVPGIGLYRTIAARCGCAGVDEPEFGPEATHGAGEQQVIYPRWCRITVRRRLASGEIVQFTAREYWLENAAWSAAADGSVLPNDIWRRRPYGQLAKCAEAQALRRAFPEIGAHPLAEELEGKAIGSADVPAPTAGPAAAARGPAPARARPAVRMPVACEPTASDAAGVTCARTGTCDLDSNAQAPTPPPPGGLASPVLAHQLEIEEAWASAPAAGADPGVAPALHGVQAREAAAPTDAAAATGAPVTVERESAPLAGGDSTGGGDDDAGAARPALSARDASLNEGVPGGNARLATAGERSYLTRRLHSRSMSIEQAGRAAGLETCCTLDALTQAEFTALLQVTA